jgi:hypothetical protein
MRHEYKQVAAPKERCHLLVFCLINEPQGNIEAILTEDGKYTTVS